MQDRIVYWKLMALDFLVEIGEFSSSSNVDQFRRRIILALKKYSSCDDIYLTQKESESVEYIFISSKEELEHSYTSTSFLDSKISELRSFSYFDHVSVPKRSHFLRGKGSVVVIPLIMSHYKGNILLVWDENYTLSKEFEIFLDIVIARIKEVMRFNAERISTEELRLKFDSIFHTVSQALIFTDDNGKNAWVNTPAKDLLELHSDLEVLPPHLVSAGMKRLREKAENASEIEKEASDLFIHPESTKSNWLWKYDEKVYRVTSSPVRSHRVNGRLWFFEDISEIYFANRLLNWYNSQLEERNDEVKVALNKLYDQHNIISLQNSDMLAQNEKLEKINQEKDSLIGIVSHDLRTPLLQITGLVKILESQNIALVPEQKSCLDLIKRVSDRGIILINDLLDISEIDQKKKTLVFESVEIHKVLQEERETFLTIAAKKNIELEVEFNASSSRILADINCLRRIFSNLISNAIKFSHRNTTVKFKTSNHQLQLLIEIQDQGQGIKEEDKKHLFGKFKRLSARPTGDENSTGLGLSIVKALVDELKGHIHCESEWKRGTSFVLTFDSLQSEKFQMLA